MRTAVGWPRIVSVPRYTLLIIPAAPLLSGIVTDCAAQWGRWRPLTNVHLLARRGL